MKRRLFIHVLAPVFAGLADGSGCNMRDSYAGIRRVLMLPAFSAGSERIDATIGERNGK